MTTYDQWLKRIPPACSCEDCKNDCCLPCWGTPAELRKLIDAGYGDRLSIDHMSEMPGVYILLPALKGFEGKEAPAKSWSAQGCTFWTPDHLCEVHESGLKPLEGKLSHHHPALKHGANLRKWIAQQWDTEAGRTLVSDWRAKYYDSK